MTETFLLDLQHFAEGGAAAGGEGSAGAEQASALMTGEQAAEEAAETVAE